MIKLNLLNKKNAGFTLIELLIVIAIFSTLIGISTISLSNLIPTASFATGSQSIVSDLKSQQFNAMTGNTSGSGDGSSYGIYLESDQYTLFTGSAYNPSATDNFVIKLPATNTITNINFSTNSIVFLQNSGEISGFNPTAASFQLQSNSGKVETYNFNKLGVITE
ncbi:MAG: prepilin-type N-terminal cleavage/methylation domain-containing protein [Candidatus Pacebacteria bacterium]|nr:prepilin-type N-terminal cleavage/methylation domain-containing protein [Candidatus Paceibacterota bacterium]